MQRRDRARPGRAVPCLSRACSDLKRGLPAAGAASGSRGPALGWRPPAGHGRGPPGSPPAAGLRAGRRRGAASLASPAVQPAQRPAAATFSKFFLILLSVWLTRQYAFICCFPQLPAHSPLMACQTPRFSITRESTELSDSPSTSRPSFIFYYPPIKVVKEHVIILSTLHLCSESQCSNSGTILPIFLSLRCFLMAW